ncbi:MAG: NUDIX hydrolase [Planctomycetota bacterium]|nr:MAG: NUDIX hydrolase [Planctomycetota bacterium]
MKPTRVLYQSRFLRLVERDGWEFVQRISTTGVVCIVAHTERQQVVLVEQFRPPVAAPIIEWPAGLVGDRQVEETPLEAARRELLEETGHVSDHWERLFVAASSAGLTDECIEFYLALNCRRVAQGGGDASESITVHTIDRSVVDDWLRQRAAAGALLDARIYAGLYWLDRRMEPQTSARRRG